MRHIDPAISAPAQAAMHKWRLPASSQIGQWAIESQWGAKSPGNNPFGIKHMVGFPDQHFLTHEVIHGRRVEQDLVFAKFPSITAAFDAHARLIATRPQYAHAMAALPDLHAFIAQLAPVYATDPNYAKTLLAVIRDNNLEQYDVAAG
jgi:flagellum-specific peptidoglycan hydrolase FlgJ